MQEPLDPPLRLAKSQELEKEYLGVHTKKYSMFEQKHRCTWNSGSSKGGGLSCLAANEAKTLEQLGP